VIHENGNTRQYNARTDGATIARSLTTEEAARRAAALIGEDSPLRPGPIGVGGRASPDFSGALGRLSEAFGQLRTALLGVEDRIEGLQGAIEKTGDRLEQLKDRVDMEDARMVSFHQRIASVEARQGSTLEGIDAKVDALSRQVGLGMGVAMLVAMIALAASFLIR